MKRFEKIKNNGSEHFFTDSLTSLNRIADDHTDGIIVFYLCLPQCGGKSGVRR